MDRRPDERSRAIAAASLSQFDASDLPIAERGAPDRTDKAGRRADPCEGQAEFSRSGEAAEKVWAVSASGQEHLSQSGDWAERTLS